MAEDIEEAADEVCDEIYAQDTKGKEFRTAENENHDISPEEDQAEDNGAGEVLGNDMVKVGERYISREYVIDEKEAEKEDGK